MDVICLGTKSKPLGLATAVCLSETKCCYYLLICFLYGSHEMCSLHFYFPSVNLNPLCLSGISLLMKYSINISTQKKNYGGLCGWVFLWVRECDTVMVGVSLCGRDRVKRREIIITVRVCVCECEQVSNPPTLSSRASPDLCCSTQRWQTLVMSSYGCRKRRELSRKVNTYDLWWGGDKTALRKITEGNKVRHRQTLN